MKTNYVLFLILSFLIIIGSNFLIGPSETPEKPPNNESTKQFSVEEDSYVVQDDSAFDARTIRKERNVDFSTPLFQGQISLNGGRIHNVSLKTYFKDSESQSPIKLLKNEEFISNTIIKFKDIDFGEEIQYSSTKRKVLIKSSDESVSMISTFANIRLEKNYSFSPNSYSISQSIVVTNNSNKNLIFRVFEEAVGEIDSKEHIMFNYHSDDDMETVTSNPSEYEKIIADIDWYGFAKKYFLASSVLKQDGEKTLKYKKYSKTNLRSVLSYKTVNLTPGSKYKIDSIIFLGPKDPEILSKIGKDFDKAQDLGWFEWLAVPLEKLLKIFNKYINNYGVSIIVITILIRLLFLPLTVKSMMSMKKMQAKMAIIKPQIDAIKEKYKDDKSTQNSETMKVYAKEGMNPLSSLSGCLPMIVQLPVFVALYNVLLYSLDLRHSDFLWIADLSSPENLFDIPGIGIPFRILPLLMGVSWFITQKMTPPNPGADEFQQKVFQYMPIMFTVMFWGLPSGLILYWTISNVISIFQQIYINRKFDKMQGA